MFFQTYGLFPVNIKTRTTKAE